LSHPYVEHVAVRTIVWFADDDTAVAALFANNKVSMGDVFYDGVGSRADQMVCEWFKPRGAGRAMSKKVRIVRRDDRVGVGQGAVSRVESREDMLLSTLLGCLDAAGATDVSMSITVAGRRLEVPFGL